jgi:hypothetical protein
LVRLRGKRVQKFGPPPTHVQNGKRLAAYGDLPLIEDAQIQRALGNVDTINAAPHFWRPPYASQLAKLKSGQFGQ